MDLYFKRHDGQAVTCDDFLAAMADANNVDLSSLAKWCAAHACSCDVCCVLRILFVPPTWCGV